MCSIFVYYNCLLEHKTCIGKFTSNSKQGAKIQAFPFFIGGFAYTSCLYSNFSSFIMSNLRRSARKNMSKFSVAVLSSSVVLGSLSFGMMPTIAMAASSGPNSSTTYVNDATVGTINWTNPTNAQNNGNGVAVVSLDDNEISRYLKGTGFGFAIPGTATVDGIKVEVERQAQASSKIKDSSVRIVKGGVIGSTNKADTTNFWDNNVEVTATYGGASDLWGTTWTAADINASNFGIVLAVKKDTAQGSSTNAEVDHIKITVYYTEVIQGIVTVNASVTNDNGGTNDVSDFTYSIDANAVTSGSANSLTAGSHTVSVSGTTGYTVTIGGDCATNGSVTVANGDIKVCSVVLDDIAPQLTVIKHVENDDGGSAEAGDFTMEVDGTDVSDASFPGEEAGTTITLDAGTYSVTESGSMAGYEGDFSADCSGVIEVGDEKTCTITNEDQKPVLTVEKVVVDGEDGAKAAGDFTLFVDATPVTTGAANEFSTGSYVVSETEDMDYEGAFSGDCDEDGNVTLAFGEAQTCTITNTAIFITICHIPTGNPDNAQTQDVRPSELDSHIGHHGGDYLGACEGDDDDDNENGGGHCGNGKLQAPTGEQCDDGNDDDDDGCSSSCQVEEGWECTDEDHELSACIEDEEELMACVPTDADIVAYWKLDEAADATMADDSTTPNNQGVISGATSGVTGATLGYANAGAYDFDGDDVISTDGTDFTFGTQEFSVNVFTKTTTGERSVLGHFDTDGSYGGWGLYYYASGNVNFFGYGDMGTNDASQAPGANVLDGNWHMVTGVYRRSGNDLTIDTYVDGALAGSSTTTVGDISINTPMLLGKYTVQPNFIGQMDDVRVYERALTSGEISDLSAGACDVEETVLPPTDTDGDTIADESDNCPFTLNVDQINTDGDSEGDACDADDDNDGDGDSLDNCPVIANEDQTDTDDDGIGDACDDEDNSPEPTSFSGFSAPDSIGGTNGSSRGEKTNILGGVIKFLAGIILGNGNDQNAPRGAFGGVAPGSFGGSSDVPLTEDELRMICSTKKALPKNVSSGLLGTIAKSLADVMDRDIDFVMEQLNDETLCGSTQAKAGSNVSTADVPFRISEAGYPVSKNSTWNACITGKVKPWDIRNNLDRDEDGLPRDCSYYHTGSLWKHPDLMIYFTWNKKTKAVTLPDGYVVKQEQKLTLK